jgi:hypothetical protein
MQPNQPFFGMPRAGWVVVAQATLSYDPDIYLDESKDIGFVGIWSINEMFEAQKKN